MHYFDSITGARTIIKYKIDTDGWVEYEYYVDRGAGYEPERVAGRINVVDLFHLSDHIRGEAE